MDKSDKLQLASKVASLWKGSSEYYNIGDFSSRPSLEKVVCLWAQDDKELRDSHIHGYFSIRELWSIREYDWSRSDARPGNAIVDDERKYFETGEEKWDAMKKDMKENGWRKKEQPALVDVGKKGRAQLSEGNHRLAIAREIGLKEVPVRFFFRKKVPDGEVVCDEAAPPTTDELTERLLNI